MKEKCNYELNEANDAKLAQKQKRDQVLHLYTRMDKKILKLTTLKSFARLNMQRVIEEHSEALNVAKDNGTTETIGEIEKFCQTLEDKM